MSYLVTEFNEDLWDQFDVGAYTDEQPAEVLDFSDEEARRIIQRQVKKLLTLRNGSHV